MAGRDATRARMDEDHEALRRALERTEALADEYRREGRQLLGALGTEMESLLEQLRRHQEWAEAHRSDEGERLVRLHREQRELIGSLVADLQSAARPPAMIAAQVAAVAGLLRRDLLDEHERAPVARGV